MTRKTFLEPEERAYTPKGSQQRKGLAIWPDGKLRRVWAGIPDTYFSIPAHGTIQYANVKTYIAGYVSCNESGEYEFNPYHRKG